MSNGLKNDMTFRFFACMFKGLGATILTIWLALFLLTTAAAQDTQQAMPNKGKIFYQGTYSGIKTKKEKPKPIFEQLLDKALKGNKIEGEELTGGITIEISFDGASIVGEYKTTGLLSPAKVSGIFESGICKMFGRTTGTMEGECTPLAFVGSIRSPKDSNILIDVKFEARQIKIVDLEDISKQAAIASEQRKAQLVSGANTTTNPTASESSGSAPNSGSVTYQGTYAGDLTTTSGRSSRSAELAGALNATLTFNGQAVEAVLKTTGPMREARITGLRVEDQCKLFFKNGDILEGPCNSTSFSGIIRSPIESRNQISVSFSSSASKVVDFVEQAKIDAEQSAERAKQRAAQAEKNRIEAIAARQLPPPDLDPVGGNSTSIRSMQIRLSNIDDSGYAFVVTPDSNWVGVLAVEWESGVPGLGEEEVSKSFAVGTNFLILGVHNKAFQLGMGKWSYQFEITGDGRSIWSKAGGALGGGVGTRYWKPFTVKKAKNGALEIRAASAEEIPKIVDRMKRFNDETIQRFGTETSAMGALLKGLSQSMMSSGSSGGEEDCTNVSAPKGSGDGDAHGNITICTRNGQGAYRPR